MRGPKAKPLRVPRGEKRRLRLLVRRRKEPYGVVLRARMVLLSARGLGPTEVARQLGCAARTVRKWRARFRACPQLESLYEGERPGRPPKFDIATRCDLVGLACERPDGDSAPYRAVWTQLALAESLEDRTGVDMSRSTVQRILAAEGLRPHRVHYWLHSQDPDFRPKVRVICGLYTDPPKDAVVICVDEKPIQALERKHATGIGPKARVRYEYEYIRHGTCTLLGAFDVQTGQVFGRVVPKRSAKALVRFMNDLAKRYPGKQVYVVWDNLNIHKDGKDQRWTKFNAEHGGRFHFVYTPLHASWVNQIEIWFSILQRRILRHGSFEDLAEVRRAVHGFIRFWNRYEAHPFRWKFRGRFVDTTGRRAA